MSPGEETYAKYKQFRGSMVGFGLKQGKEPRKADFSWKSYADLSWEDKQVLHFQG
jgi:hypothetical protein